MSDPREFRPLVVWEATHDNGWTTRIDERRDGSFRAWAGSRSGRGIIDSIMPSVEAAHRTVMSSLRSETGHTTCSRRCSDWDIRSRRAPSQT